MKYLKCFYISIIILSLSLVESRRKLRFKREDSDPFIVKNLNIQISNIDSPNKFLVDKQCSLGISLIARSLIFSSNIEMLLKNERRVISSFDNLVIADIPFNHLINCDKISSKDNKTTFEMKNDFQIRYVVKLDGAKEEVGKKLRKICIDSLKNK